MIVTPSGSFYSSLCCSHCNIFNKQTLLDDDFREISCESQGECTLRERNHSKVTKIVNFGLKFTVSDTFVISGVFHMKGQIGNQRDISGEIFCKNTTHFQKNK